MPIQKEVCRFWKTCDFIDNFMFSEHCNYPKGCIVYKKILNEFKLIGMLGKSGVRR